MKSMKRGINGNTPQEKIIHRIQAFLKFILEYTKEVVGPLLFLLKRLVGSE